jgi:hypothetical protein
MDIRRFMAGLSLDPYRDEHRNPSSACIALVADEIEAGDMDGAAKDLCLWLSISTGDGAESDHQIDSNAKIVITATEMFLSAHGGAEHRRPGCLRSPIPYGAHIGLGVKPRRATIGFR